MFTIEFIIFAALAVLFLGLPAFQGSGEGRSATPVLRVVGEAEVSVEPDVVMFDLGATIRNPSASKAMAEVARITDRLMTTLKSADIPEENIRTTQLALDEARPPSEAEVERGETRRMYEATHAVRVAVEKEGFVHLGDILDAAIRVGANFVEGITYSVRDEVPLRREGLMEAVKDARSKAEAMAAAANAPIRGILTLTEGRDEEPFGSLLHQRLDLSLSSVPSPVPPARIRRTYTVLVEYSIG